MGEPPTGGRRIRLDEAIPFFWPLLALAVLAAVVTLLGHAKIKDSHLDQYFGLFGFWVGALGFYATIVTSYKALQTSTDARRAVTDLNGRLSLFDTNRMVAEAISAFEEVERLRKLHDGWSAMSERLSVVIRRLVAIREHLGDEGPYDMMLVETLSQLRDLRSLLLSAEQKNIPPSQLSKRLEIAARNIDELSRIPEALRRQMSDGKQ